MAIYNAPTFVNGQPPALSADVLNPLVQAVEQDGVDIQTLQTQQANPYSYKGAVAAVSDLPSSGNTINDTYYVTAEGCLYTWNGSAWSQSSVKETDYQAALTALAGNFAGVYSNAATYAVGDYCVYNNGLYRCITAISTSEEWTAAHWTAVTVTGEVADVKSALGATDDRMTNVDGITVPVMELGTIAMASTSIAFNSSTIAIRTPQTGPIPVNNGDVIHLTDYTAAKYRWCIHKTSDNKYAYTSVFVTEDTTVGYDGDLYLVVEKSEESTITDVAALAALIRVEKRTGDIYGINTNLEHLNAYENILEFGKFNAADFGVGSFGSGAYNPTLRPYRVSSKKTLQYSHATYIRANTGYRFSMWVYQSGAWTAVGWVYSYAVPANTPFGLVLAKVTEDTTSTANVADFVNNFSVNTDLTNRIIAGESISVDGSAISEFMSRYYASNDAEGYAFFTDPHLMGSAGAFDADTFNGYMKVFAETVKQTSAAYIVCGGDWLNREDTRAQAAKKLGYVDGQMRSMFPGKYYPIVGNHDFNYLGYEGGTRLPENQWVSNSAMRNFWFHEYEQCYYKFKRMIAQNYVLNTRTDYDGTNTYDKTMLDWFAAQLITDNPAHATIMFHMLHLSNVASAIPTRVKAIGKIIEAFNAHTDCTLTNATEGYDKTYDFTGTTGKIDYVIVGHTHADFTETLGGVPVIGCVNFTKDNMASFDLVFADYTAGKVYTTRVGSGESREFSI